MPSAGSKIIPVRIPAELLEEIGKVIESRNRHSPGEPWDRSEFIRQAIRDKISHAKRSRSPKRVPLTGMTHLHLSGQ